MQLDWCVGQILETIDRRGLASDTLVIFSSDNGPVVDDGYHDDAVAKLGGHRPAGDLRGGKYKLPLRGARACRLRCAGLPGSSRAFGTALACQIDLVASLAALVGVKLADTEAPDSFDILPALLGTSATGRDHLVEHVAGVLCHCDRENGN